VVLSCGARYRRPSLANLRQFEGKGVYYWASPVEAKLCKTEEIILVGGGNSAGQAAVFLSGQRQGAYADPQGQPGFHHVQLPDRADQATPNISCTRTEIVALEGDEEGLRRPRPPYTERTGNRLRRVPRVPVHRRRSEHRLAQRLRRGRRPARLYPHRFRRHQVAVPRQLRQRRVSADLPERAALETSVPGVFAIGDVRATSTKRVAAAVGEGAAVVAQIHAFLASLPLTQA
jgi:thioredoxin reductase (NADPH)